MKCSIESILVLTPLLAIGFLFSPSISAQDEKPASLDDRISYAYGVVVARDLQRQGLPINVEQFMKGFATISKGGESLLTEDEIGKTFDEKQMRVDEQNAKGEDKVNLDAGKTFLAENAKKEGIMVTNRGLQYQVIKQGDGPKPKLDSAVKVHYQGTLIDGTVFDSSVQRNEPASFRLTQVIPGWTEALQLMPVGSKYRFFIPYHLAYGDAARGKFIKPYSALVFEIELLEIL